VSLRSECLYFRLPIIRAAGVWVSFATPNLAKEQNQITNVYPGTRLFNTCEWSSLHSCSALTACLPGQPAKIVLDRMLPEVSDDEEVHMPMFYSNHFMRMLLLFFVSSTCAVTLAQSPKTLTESGTISGVREGGLNVYKGAPFAAPPVGDLRWRAPAPVAPWVGARKASTSGHRRRVCRSTCR
jgi:hypothetical protein